MDLGRMIRQLRIKKDVTQEQMATDLGVTATAVSKWENGYTLPDVLMLVALADYFSVTTDELLGRNLPEKHAVILAENQALGEKMEALIKRYGFCCHGIYLNKEGVLGGAQADQRIEYLFAGVYQGGYQDDTPLQKIVSTHKTDWEILDGLEWAITHCLDNEVVHVLN